MNSEPGKVTVVGGMPTAQGATSPESLPSSTTNFVKLLEEQGFEVDVAVPREDRNYVDLNSLEIWLPILVFAVQPAWDMAVTATISAIKSLYSNRKVSAGEEADLPPGRLHLRCFFEEPDGARREFDAHGPPSSVIQSLKEFSEID